ncbi:MAG: hypothetical protein AAGF47_04460 [Planctomycetota bacterium]
MHAINELRHAVRSTVKAIDTNHPPHQGYIVPVIVGLVMYGGIATIAAGAFLSLAA